MNQLSDPIAVFDSGMGGISVLREMTKLMPNEGFYLLSRGLQNTPLMVQKHLKKSVHLRLNILHTLSKKNMQKPLLLRVILQQVLLYAS